MKKKFLIRILIIFVVVLVLSFSDWTFAVEDVTLLEKVAKWLNFFVSILSWVWIWFARWAWEFLTNKWVFWEIIWLDALLWKLWVVMKNIANFWLWFYFIYVVFSSLILKDKIFDKLKKTLLYMLIAWIAIQASWFICSVVIDVSTITLVAAWSLPAQIISTNDKVEVGIFKWMKDQLDPSLSQAVKWIIYNFSPINARASKFIEVDYELLNRSMKRKELLDEILPRYDSVSWPLYYLWFTILKTTNLISIDWSDEKWFMATIFNTLLQWGTTIVYSLEMLVLFIASVMRVVYIRIFIVLSPLVILLRCISQIQNNKKWDWLLSGFYKNFNIKSFIINAFKPTIIVIWFWLSLVFVSLMNWIIESSANSKFDMDDIHISSTKDSGSNITWDEWDQTYTTTIDTNILQVSLRHAWKTILEMILSIITVFLVYYIVSIAVTMWWWDDFVSKNIKKVQDWVEELTWMVPLVPVSWFDKNWQPTTHFISAGRVLSWKSDWLIATAYREKLVEPIQNVTDEQTLRIQQAFWWWDVWISVKNQRELNRTFGRVVSVWGESLKEVKNFIQNPDNKISWLTFAWSTDVSKWWIEKFWKWLEDMNTRKDEFNNRDNSQARKNMVEWWNKEENKESRTIEKLFSSNPSFIVAYVKFFNLWASIDTWNELKSADASKSATTSTSK